MRRSTSRSTSGVAVTSSCAVGAPPLGAQSARSVTGGRINLPAVSEEDASSCTPDVRQAAGDEDRMTDGSVPHSDNLAPAVLEASLGDIVPVIAVLGITALGVRYQRRFNWLF